MSATVHGLVAPLSTEQLWKKPYPYGNSIGHLLLHLTGNLSHYIGAPIANTGYVRNRPLEFSDGSKRSKEQVLADFDAAIAMVASTIRKQSPGIGSPPLLRSDRAAHAHAFRLLPAHGRARLPSHRADHLSLEGIHESRTRRGAVARRRETDSRESARMPL